MIGWMWLALAISTEIAGTVALRYSAGFTSPIPTTIAIAGYIASTYFLALTLRSISLSTAYAVWSGVGTAVVAGIGMAVLGERTSAFKVMSILLIIAGVVGLHLAE